VPDSRVTLLLRRAAAWNGRARWRRRLRWMSENALVAAILALALAGLAGRASGLASWAWDRGPFGRSATERSVDALLRNSASSAFWRTPPHMSSAARAYLAAHWDALDPGRVHPYVAGAAEPVALDALLEDRTLDGRTLSLDAFVSYVLSTSAVAGGRVHQLYQLTVDGQRSAAWCRSTVPADREVRIDDELNVTAVVLARGAADLAGGGFENGTDLACPAVAKNPAGPDRVSVAQLYESLRTDGFWDSPPQMSVASRTFLEEHWARYDPYVVHRSSEPAGASVPFGRLMDDPADYDGQPVTVGGWVTDVSTERADGGLFERVLLNARGSTIGIWCYVTQPRGRRVAPAWFARASGVVVARGWTADPAGGYHAAIVMLCPSVWLYR
jgi:hypothetical protein